MIKHNQNGQISGVAVALVFTSLLLVGALGFAGWAFVSRQDYKNNSDAKVATAVTIAKQREDGVKDKAFIEVLKQPLRTYNGPEAYGSIIVAFPKSWSGYVDDTGNGASLVDGYFHPSIIPSVTSPTSVFALRVQVLNQSYSQVVDSISNTQQAGKLTIAAYALPKVPKTVGIKAVGMIKEGLTGEMIVLPLRDKTIEISTQGTQFTADFENNVLPNFSFAP